MSLSSVSIASSGPLQVSDVTHDQSLRGRMRTVAGIAIVGPLNVISGGKQNESKYPSNPPAED